MQWRLQLDSGISEIIKLAWNSDRSWCEKGEFGTVIDQFLQQPRVVLVLRLDRLDKPPPPSAKYWLSIDSGD